MELRSPEPAIEDPLKAAEEFDATVTKKSAEDDGEVQALVSPQSLGSIFIFLRRVMMFLNFVFSSFE